MALCLAQLCSAVPISPAQRVWGMSPSLRAAAAAAAALPVQGTVTKCPKHLWLSWCLSICICSSVPRCHSLSNEISIPPLPPRRTFPGICLCLDLINMECAAACPVGDAQVCTHPGLAVLPLLIFPLVLLTVSVSA